MAESTAKSFMCRLMACVLTAGLLVSSARSTPGGDDVPARQEPNQHRPTAAFLELEGSPLTGLLEGRLLENPRVVWLERNAIEEIQREQKLQGLAEAAATRRRVAIGKLLKADLLVLLRHVEKPKEHLQLVVCETKRGLRLAVDRMVLTPKVEADVQQLSALVERAIARHGQEIREICAVPPFVSNDLTYENEHLEAAYAKLVEQTIRDRPGLLCVEFEEAREIAREVAIATEGIRRPMPLYLLGEFRHEGKNGKQTATVRIRVMRGDRELASRQASQLSPAHAAKFVRQTSAELIDQTVGVRKLPPNPKLEAEQLARRAETFHLLGSWDEAAGLAQASLLLDSRQTRMHELAASSLASLASRLADPPKGPESVARGIHLYLRALDHFETLLPEVSGRIEEHHLWHLQGHLRRAVHWDDVLIVRDEQPEVNRVAAELRKRELEPLLRMTRARCRAQTGDEYRFLAWAVFGRPRQEQFEILLQTVRAIQNLPAADQMICRLTLHGYSVNHLDNPEGRRYLQELMAFDNEVVRRAATELEDRLEEYVAAKTEQPPKKPAAGSQPIGPQHVRFEPLKIHYPPQGHDLPGFHPFGGWIPAGEGVDLVWAGRYLYVMKQPGRLKLIWDAWHPVKLGRITAVDYDGRFAWVTTEHLRGKPQLLVLDPEQERIWEIDEDDGLPVVPWQSIPDPHVYPQLWAEPLEPGKILLVSWFGRLAIGTVTFAPDTGAQTDLFFEARHPLDHTKNKPGRDPRMAFRPGYVIGFRGTDQQGRPLRRVLVGARGQFAEYGRHDRPLVVDPDSKRVDVLPHAITSGLEPHRLAFTPEAVYRVQVYYMELRLERIGLPDLKPRTLMTGVPEGYCVKYGDNFAILGSRCWLVDPKAPPQQRISVIAPRPAWKYGNASTAGAKFAGEAAEPPHELLPFKFRRICRSNHFGLLAVRSRVGAGCEFLRIVFDQ